VASLGMSEDERQSIERFRAEVIEPFAAIRTDLVRMGAASFVAEVTDRATPERDPQPAVYRTLRQALEMIAGGDAELAAMWFAAQVLVLAGYAPVVDRCVVCGRAVGRSATFSFALGGSLCAADRPRDPEAVPASAVALAAISFLREASPKALARVSFERPQRAEVESLLRRYVEYRLEVRLRSPLVIEQLGRLR